MMKSHQYNKKRTLGASTTNRIIILCVLAVFVVPSIRNLSFNVWLGALASGLCFSLVALGVFISFRVLNFPDLTVEGSFPLGSAVAASLITSGMNPFLTLPIAFTAGAVSGVVTAFIATRLRIHSLLASILTATALYSINLRVMSRSNIPLLDSPTVFAPVHRLVSAIGGSDPSAAFLRVSGNLTVVLSMILFLLLTKFLLDRFLLTEYGLAVLATGDNPTMIRALGVNTNAIRVFGLALSNGMIGLSGAIVSQFYGFADVNIGQGLIISGLAAVILGEALLKPGMTKQTTRAVVLGMIIYRLVIAAVLSFRLRLFGALVISIDTKDIKIATALLVLLALWLERRKPKRGGK